MLYLLFFRGKGIVPVLVRLFTWRWFEGQKWKDVPSHVAIVAPSEYGVLRKYEAVVTGIQSSAFCFSEIEGDKCVIANIGIEIGDENAAYEFLERQVGERYGFEAVALTGIAVLSPAWVDRLLASVWTRLHGGQDGETCPLDCSLLCQKALENAGVPSIPPRRDGMPVSPSDLLIAFISMKDLKIS